VLADARAAASTRSVDGGAGRVGALIIILLWIVALLAAVYLVLRLTKRI